MDFSFTPEQLAFREQVLKFSAKEIAPLAEEMDLKAEWSWEAWRKMGDFGLLGLHYPEEYGGAGADVVTTCVAGEALGEGGADSGLMLAYGAHSFLCGDTILRHGTPEQKKKYLPGIASGKLVGAMGLTEPGAGSDAAAIATRADRVGDKWRLNGTKMFITNGPIADVVVVFAVTNKEAGPMGISGFIVEKDTPGFRVGKVLHKMNVRASQTSELIFDNAEVPAENLLGQEGMGFVVALGALEWDRSALLAPGIGAARKLLRDCTKYSNERKQFGRPIFEFQAIQHKLADMRIYCETARLLLYRVAWKKDQGQPLNHLEASIAKLYVGEYGLAFGNDAVQIHGGYGLMHEYPVERFYRDVKLGSIGGGTSEIQRMIIARTLPGDK
jgi:alkylation response protein AidB-like acyl-CoA dehydrogenase